MQNNSTDFYNNQIPISTPPEKVLAGFNYQLGHFISSIDACTQILEKNPGEETRQHVLDIISRNIVLMNSERKSVMIYLEKRVEKG